MKEFRGYCPACDREVVIQRTDNADLERPRRTIVDRLRGIGRDVLHRPAGYRCSRCQCVVDLVQSRRAAGSGD